MEKQTKSSSKKDRILEVASAMFIEHGYAAVTMEAIAEAAPVSKPTLYNHFTDKAALFFAVMGERSHRMFHEFQDKISRKKSPEETLKEIGEAFLDIILKPETIGMYRIMIGDGKNFPELGQLFYESGPKKSLTLLADYLKDLDQKGILKVENPILSANFYLNMIKGYPHMQCLLGVKNKISQKERSEIINYAVQVFINGHKK